MSREGIQRRTGFIHDSVAGPQAHPIATVICVICVLCGVATRKNISIRDDQAEWVEDNHLNLSSFVQEKLDELIEERE